MPDEPYSLSDLARLAGVTPRTVRYYVAQGLLPSPDPAGPATRYGEGHLDRLRLIRLLQRDHLPLAEIRGRLERMTDAEVRGVLEAAEGSAPLPVAADALAYVRDLMARTGVQPRVSETRASYRTTESTFPRQAPDEFPQPHGPAPSTAAPPASAPPPMVVPAMPASLPRPAVGDRTTWERHLLGPDVELHVRRPLDRRTNKRVEQLVRIARELFDEEP